MSANLLDGMVCVNDTYMLPGRNNLSITVVSDPQRNASVQRIVLPTSAATNAIASAATTTAPCLTANASQPSTAVSASNSITISRTAMEIEKQRQLLINPLTGNTYLFFNLINIDLRIV